MKPLRLQRCMERMQTERMSQLIVSSKANLYYLTGQVIDTGERLCCLLFRQERQPVLFLHQMFYGQLTLPEEIEVVLWADEDDPIAVLAETIVSAGAVGIDQVWSSAFLIDLLRRKPAIQPIKSQVVEQLRAVKDDGEINLLRQSARIADAVMHQLVELQYFPATEQQMAETIRSFFGEHQVQELAFTPIIGFGKNSANPHHAIGDTGLVPEQAIVIDMGGKYQQYCSDITRTLYYGRPNKRFAEIHQIVREAQEKAIALVKPGVTFAEIDRLIRQEFARYGYERYFTHRTGHGLGLELHEEPFVHQNNQDVLVPGMVFSIEPGIYLPDQFGVRIEDIVVVTETGHEVLGLSPKEVSYIEIKEG